MQKLEVGAGLETQSRPAQGKTGGEAPQHEDDGPLPTETYSLELRAGAVMLASREFHVHFQSEYSDEPEVLEVSTFQMMPWDPLTLSVALVHGKETVDERMVTLAAPSVSVTRPNVPETWPAGTTQEIAWEASDPDSASLTFSVLYRSRDDRDWELLAHGLTETSLEVAVDSLAGATQGFFRVVASDGINVGFDESDAPVVIPGHPPVPIITNPADGAHFAPGGLVVLLGIATDMEDGMVPEDGLSWTSDLAGELGTGGTLTITDLVPGTHRLTLSTVDSEGHEATTTIRIVVNSLEVFRADLNEDGVLSEADLFELMGRWHQSAADGYPPAKADLNDDGVVDAEDLLRFQQYWGVGPN
ncbi:hypothetical protein HS125_06780 [bacterium]|nr:hypothetical protein [bacterium]